MRKIFFSSLLGVAFLLTVSPTNAGFVTVDPSDWSGSRSTDNNEIQITGNGGWDQSRGGFQIAWEISFAPSDPNSNDNGVFTYRYDITSALGGDLAKALSHIILSLSQGSTVTTDTTLSSNLLESQPKTYQADDGSKKGNSNPGLPADFYGVKYDATDTDSTQFTVVFETESAPVWGSFYAKDGKDGRVDTWAYNQGLDPRHVHYLSDGYDESYDNFNGYLMEDNAALYQYFIATPDTKTYGPGETPMPNVVPEPSSLVLLTLGALGLVGYGYRRRKGEASA